MANSYPLLSPVIALVLWCGVVWGWMYLTRIPAMVRARIRLDPALPRGEQMAGLPAPVRWKADNYNHLMEQPPLFYAIAIVLTLLGETSAAVAALAWTYFGLRVAHSLVHATVNHIPTRFGLFVLSSVVLWALAIRAAGLAF